MHEATLNPPDPDALGVALVGPESAADSAGNDVVAPRADAKPAYPPSAAAPTQQAARGLRFDFNCGARLLLPQRTEGEWRVRIKDLDTGNILFESTNQGALVASAKRYFVRFGLEVSDGRDIVFEHAYDCRDRLVLVQLPVGTLGDTLAWISYIARFQALHGCKLVCALSELIIPLLEDNYPHITFVTHKTVVALRLAEQAYATYSIGLFFDDADNIWQPTDFRLVGLHRTAGYILGVDPTEAPPLISCGEDTRPIAEPYVCIAVQSSSGCKMWNNPSGWHDVVAHLKARGYRVVCIDQKKVHGSGLFHTHIPHGVEDETGDRPLTERARWLKHAEAFVGVSSGLAWLAWGAGTPVVMISGFTHPTNEFATPYRVINWHACNSCWNDPSVRFKHDDFMWCPRHENTARQFECSRLITGSHVVNHLDKALASGIPNGLLPE